MAPSPEWILEERLAGTRWRRLSEPGRERPAPDEPAEAYEGCELALHAPRRWGRSAEAVAHLGDRLSQCWRRFRGGFTTRTRDTSAHAYDSLRAQLTLDTARHCATMERTLHGGDGQALQHCMSTSPWSGPAVFEQRHAESKAPPALAHGSPLMLDERAEEQAGTHHAGASRQDHGRLGKVAVCRVDTCLTSAHGGLWAMVDGELCLPEAWCGVAFAQTRPVLGIPPDRTCETTIAWGLKMVKRVQGKGGPCDLVACDALDGRESQWRADVAAEDVQDAAQVPAETLVYRSEPHVGLPLKRGTRGRPPPRLHVRRGQRPHAGRALAQPPQTGWPRVQGRCTERGWWTADVAVRRVWTVAAGQRPRAAWLVIRRHSDGDCSSTLLNAPTDTPQACLIAWSGRRYCTERPCEDAKTASGWDAFQAQK